MRLIAPATGLILLATLLMATAARPAGAICIPAGWWVQICG